MLRKLLALVALLTGLVVATGPALPTGAQTAPDYADCIVRVVPASFPAGATVTVSGTGLQPNFTTSIKFDGVEVGTPTTDAAGSFSTTVQIPPAATVGFHSITVACGGENDAGTVVRVNPGGGGGGGGGGTTTTTTTTPGEEFPDCIVSVDPATFAAGATVTVSGSGLQPNLSTAISLRNGRTVQVGTAITDSNGSFTTTVRIPDHSPPGRHSITVGCDAAGNVSSADVTVRGVVITPPGPGGGGNAGGGNAVSGAGLGSFPRTGSDAEALVVAGGVALLAGTAFVVAAKRRRRTAPG